LGLALQQSFQLTSQMKMLIAQVAQVEAMMSSVERIKHYSHNIDVEESLMLEDPTMKVSDSVVSARSVVPQAEAPPVAQEDFSSLVLAPLTLVDERINAAAPPVDWPSTVSHILYNL